MPPRPPRAVLACGIPGPDRSALWHVEESAEPRLQELGLPETTRSTLPAPLPACAGPAESQASAEAPVRIEKSPCRLVQSRSKPPPNQNRIPAVPADVFQ